MIAHLLRLTLALLVAEALGLALRWVLLHGRDPRPFSPAALGVAFPLGLGVLAAWMMVLAAAEIPFQLLSVAVAPAGVILGAAVVRRRAAPAAGAGVPERTPLLPTRLVAPVLGLCVVAVAAGAFIEPVGEIDAIAAWSLFGRIYFHEGTVFADYITSGACGNAVTHWRPFYPLMQAYGHLAMGQFDDHAIKLLAVAVFLAILAVLYGTLRRRLSRGDSLAVLILTAGAPLLLLHFPGGSVASFLADVPLGLFMVAAAASLVAWLETRDPGHLAVAALLCASAVWLKREGLVFALTAALAVALVAWRGGAGRRHRRLLREALPFVGVVLAAIVLFALYSRQLPGGIQGTPLRLDRLTTGEGPARFLALTGYFLADMVNPMKWGVLWPLLALLAGLRRRHLGDLALGVPLILIAGHVAAAVLAMTVSDFTLEWHRGLDIRRVVTQLAPLGTLAVGLLLAGPSPAPPIRAGAAPRRTG